MNRGALPPIGDEIASYVESFCRRRGLDPRRAQQQGHQQAELMLTLFAGQTIAFPAHPFRARELAIRDAEIRRKYNGKNTIELADKYHLSRQWIWTIVNSDP